MLMGDFIFWISLSRNLLLRPLTLPTKTELRPNPKSEVTFLIRSQRLTERKLSLSDSLSPKFGHSDSLRER